ncbi:MAG TPA: M1 family metallopeptidase [Flavobacterium sp.]|jgi:aminopeptidase N
MRNKLFLGLIVLGFQSFYAQESFTRRDTLLGGLRPERTGYNVLRYDLDITVDPSKKSVAGVNRITYELYEGHGIIQIDLFENMNIDSIVQNKKMLKYRRELASVFVELPLAASHLEKEYQLDFYYSGIPIVAPHAPWDGGFVWDHDKTGKPWIGVAVQGTGASLWYPCKDSQTDEPDRGASIKVAVPNGLMNVSNGRFKGSTDLKNGFTRWDWEVISPINNYDITVNIADYAHIHDNHKGLDLDYYVLRYNEQTAKKHFEEVKTMMDCFQSKFGEYPFAKDGFKLVETPYLGMEHQSAVAYGNGYVKGYRGNDMSGTGIGLLFDYITIHESGHEWFGNSVTSKDIADMWIHEGFTCYSEAVYVECTQGYEKAMDYLNGIRRNVRNFAPIISAYGVNNQGSGDMYPKGALLLNTIRHIMNDDTKWWLVLKNFAEKYRHQIIDTPTVIAHFSEGAGIDLKPVFDQYLTTTNIPELVLNPGKEKLTYQWKNTIEGFAMPVDVLIDGKQVRIYPTTKSSSTAISGLKPKDIKPLMKEFFIKYNN